MNRKIDELLNKYKDDVDIFDIIKKELKIEVPDKYVFKIDGKDMRIDEIFKTFDLPLDKILMKVKYLINLEGYSIDKKEFFSIAEKFYKDKNEVEYMRLKKRIRKPDEDLNDVLLKHGLRSEFDSLISEGEFQEEIDFISSLKIELIDEVQILEKEEKFLLSIKNPDFSTFDLYDSSKEKERILINLDLQGYEPKEVFETLSLSTELFYIRLKYDDKDTIKTFLNEHTKEVLTDKIINKDLDDMTIECKFYPLDTGKKYMFKAVVNIFINLYTGSTMLSFNVHKDMNINSYVKLIISKLSVFKPKIGAEIPDTNKFIISGFNFERDVFIYIIFTYFRDLVYFDESKKPAAAGIWTRFYLLYKKARVAITMNNEILKIPLTVKKGSLQTKLGHDTEITKITISQCPSKEHLNIALDLVKKCLEIYLREYNSLSQTYLLPKLVKPKIIKKKITSIKEIIPDFSGGGISSQGNSERLVLNIVSDDEAKELLENRESVMMYPPPNMKDMFDTKIKPIYIGPGSKSYPYIGLKVNTSTSGDLSHKKFPYIPMYFKKEKIEVDDDFNVKIIEIKERDMDRKKNKGKDLLDGEKGSIDEDILKILDTEGCFRIGYNDFVDVFSDEDIQFDKVEPYHMQELYDYTTIPSSVTFETHHAVFEKELQTNIYLFERTKDKLSMVVPRHKDFYVCNPILYSRCMILFRNKKGGYELVRRSKNITFNKEVNKRFLDLMIYLTQVSNMKVINIYDYFPKILSQTIADGKVNSINAIFNDEEITVLTPPLHPLDLPITKEIKSMKSPPEDAKKDVKGLGCEYKIKDVKFRSYTDYKDLDVDKNLFFADIKTKDVDVNKIKIKANILKEIFGVFLLLSKSNNFVDKYTTVIEDHEYEVEYDDFEVEDIKDMKKLDMPSYISKGKIILSSDEMKSRFKRLSEVLLKQYEDGLITLAPPPYIFKKKYNSISDFTISSKNEYIFSDLNHFRIFLYEKRSEMSKVLFTSLPPIVTAEIKEKKTKSKVEQVVTIYPSAYNLPVQPILYFDGNDYYWIQYVKDTEYFDQQIKAVEAIIYNWERSKVNTGYYTSYLDEDIEIPSYDKIKPNTNNKITPKGKSCMLMFLPQATHKIKKPKSKYAAVLKI